MKKHNWIWMPHPAHLIVARDCRFHLSTYVGAYIISTVGEYEPGMEVREIQASTRGLQLEGRGDARRHDAMKKLGFTEIGLDRVYETMVFEAVRAPNGEQCCPWRQQSGSNIDFMGYGSAQEATLGHMKLCLKWSKK